MDCATISYAGVVGSSPTENKQTFVPFLLFQPSYLKLGKSLKHAIDLLSPIEAIAPLLFFEYFMQYFVTFIKSILLS